MREESGRKRPVPLGDDIKENSAGRPIPGNESALIREGLVVSRFVGWIEFAPITGTVPFQSGEYVVGCERC